MAKYDTAGNIVIAAARECSLTPPSDPFASTTDEMVQMCNLLTSCGQELMTSHQWQQLVVAGSISTGASPVASGSYSLPADFNYMINQTGWTPNSSGLGLPLGGPLSEQIWTALVATGLSSSTIYVSFKVAGNLLKFLPAPAPANITITYEYMSRYWVALTATPTVPAQDAPTISTDVILFDRILMIKMLAARYKQQKSLPADSSLEQFTLQYGALTGIDTPGPLLRMNSHVLFPYLNVWTNAPQSGYGS